MKILCFGNSFSVDANTYFYDIATAGGADIEVLNLNIASCSFEMHARAAVENFREYEVQYNGRVIENTLATAEEGLKLKNWDIVTVQQLSEHAGLYDTYFPHINIFLDKIRTLCPSARIILHQPWAYEKDFHKPYFAIYDRDQIKMHKAVHNTCRRVLETASLDSLIPTGDVIARLREYDCFDIDKGGLSIARDGIHLSLTYGRYAAAATWYMALGLGDIAENSFIPPCFDGEEIDMKKIALIKKSVKEICEE